MDSQLDFRSRWGNTRAQVYLLWAALTAVGYVATYFFQNRLINPVWIVLSVIGLGFMYKVMPIRLTLMKRIFTAWLVPIAIGITVSGLVFYIDAIAQLLAYLGAFWLALQAVGFAWNGVVDPPSKWYYIAASVNLAAAILCWQVEGLYAAQYLIAAIVTVWSMLMLWIYRAD